VLRDGDAVVARTSLGRAQRVIIAGHIDTVPINANVPSRLDEVNGQQVVWGRGAVDMKAGCAVALKLAVEITEPSVDVTWIFYDHEEVSAELNGLGRLGRTQPQLLEGDFAILGEPSNARIEGGCNGTLRVEVRTSGRRAHSARAWTGENAIHALAPLLATLSAYEAETIVVDGLAYREGLSAVGVRGGVASNVIPDEAVLTVNYRFAPDKTEAEAEAHVRSVFAGLNVVVVDSAPGARPGLTSTIAAEFVQAVGGEPQPKYGWTDVARFSALGIPAVNFGPGDPELAHTDHESVPVAQIESCESVLRAWLGSSRA
jgi:succinyl-diaminopimelate desuccinylase